MRFFNSIKLKHIHMPKIKYFSADWCSPCKQQKPIINEIEGELDDVTVSRHDVEDASEEANKFNVRSVPTLIVLNDDGNVVDQFTGLTQKDDLVAAIEEAGTNEAAPL